MTPNWLASPCPRCRSRANQPCVEAAPKDQLTMHWVECEPHEERVAVVMKRVERLDRKVSHLTGSGIFALINKNDRINALMLPDQVYDDAEAAGLLPANARRVPPLR